VSPWVEAAAAAAGQKVTVRRHAGFDHSYFFISSFMEDHVRFHSKALKAGPDRLCLPRHPPHYRPWFLESNGIT